MKILKFFVLITCFILMACSGGAKDKSFQVNASVDQGGAVDVTKVTVAEGKTASFRFTPNIGYNIKSVTGCNGSLSGTTYTTGTVTADCTVNANFVLNTYTLTVTTNAGGSFTIQDSMPEHGAITRVVALPDAGYGVESFSGCGRGATDYSVYTTSPITANCTVVLMFKKVVTLQGTAAEGAPLVGARVDAMCRDGSTFTTRVITDTSGKFWGQVGEQAFPCALKLTTTAPIKTYYSIATESGTTNINLLTDMALVLASGKSGADWYESADWSNVETNLANSQIALRESLYGLGYVLPIGDFSPFTAQFEIGDAWDKLLDQINAGITKTAGLTYESLIERLKSGGANQVPSPTGGSEPTAEICFNPALYAEGTHLTVKSKAFYTSESNGVVTQHEYQNTETTINRKIEMENGLPVLNKLFESSSNANFNGSGTYSVGDVKTFVDLSEKVVGDLYFKSVEINKLNAVNFYPNTFEFIYSPLGNLIDFKLSKNESRYHEYDFRFSFDLQYVKNTSATNYKVLTTFKGLTTVTHMGIEFRVCDFENQTSITDESGNNSSSKGNWYFLVGSGVYFNDRTISLVLNGEELLN
jgi:Divergent InlB B-repeat domain